MASCDRPTQDWTSSPTLPGRIILVTRTRSANSHRPGECRDRLYRLPRPHRAGSPGPFQRPVPAGLQNDLAQRVSTHQPSVRGSLGAASGAGLVGRARRQLHRVSRTPSTPPRRPASTRSSSARLARFHRRSLPVSSSGSGPVPLTRFGLTSGSESDPGTIQHWDKEAHDNGWIMTSGAVYGDPGTPAFAGIWPANGRRLSWSADGILDQNPEYQDPIQRTGLGLGTAIPRGRLGRRALLVDLRR